MKQLTSNEAKDLASVEWWKNKTAFEISEYQLIQKRLCMPVSVFTFSLSTALERPVYTHELANPDALLKELRAIRPMVVGDVVEPIKPEYQLASGCERYDSAVVVSIEPLVLVSHASDMRWGCTVKREHFHIIGSVDGAELAHCMERLTF